MHDAGRVFSQSRQLTGSSGEPYYIIVMKGKERPLSAGTRHMVMAYYVYSNRIPVLGLRDCTISRFNGRDEFQAMSDTSAPELGDIM